MPRKILLADDSVTAQNMGRKILHDAGYEVVTVNNGSAALKKVAEAKPELIVLDVYMPGYSGLEVCQRIKETRETAHIPVLLTVGKLEPFKQDEARRVRADAFIIKPFEATELLAALGKLEGQIVLQPDAGEAKLSSATMAEFERVASERGKRYGDEESGWKARLTIPSAGAKLTEAEPEPEAAVPITSSFRDIAAEEKPCPAVPSSVMMDRPIPAGIPQDITPDEINALAAAAARLRGGVNVEKDFERLAEKAPETGTEKKQEDGGKVQQAEVEITAEATTADITTSPGPLSAAATAKPGLEAEKPSEPKLAEPPTGEANSAPQAANGDTELQPASQAVPTEAEVDVVLQSIESRKDADSVGTTLASAPAPEPEPVAVAMAAASSATMAVGPRWVAEEVPVEANEAELILEAEMRKARAAFSAAENAAPRKFEPAVIDKYEPAPVDKADEPIFATMAPPPIGAPVPVHQSIQSQPAPAHSDKESELDPGFKASRSEIAKPPAPPFTPPVASGEAESKHAAPALGGPHLEEAESAATETAPGEHKSAADQATAAEREADLASATAAAWSSWKDIRESITGAKPDPRPSQAVEADELEQLKAAKGLKSESQPAPEPEAAMAAAASADGSSGAMDPNLSSIVDSMLAELKPKLMAELAEKLKKEKK